MVDDADDLAYVRRKPGYLVQAYVGTETEEYTAGCFMDSDGALAPSCVMRRELLAGTTYRATLGDFQAVRAEAERIVAALKPRGPCNVQLRLTEQGPVCFEINPRFSGTTPIRAHYGYNEVNAAIGNFLLDEPVRLPLVTKGVALRYWNELYVETAAVEALNAAGTLLNPAQYPTEIETYGHRA
jgi:carbamoyl-phosphate synthase large subunit